MKLIKNVSTIGGLTAVSRLFGFLRDILIARVLGATAMGDAWQLAFMLPNIFRRLFAEGAFASAFIPLFNRRVGMDGDKRAALSFAEEILAILLPVLVIFGGIALILMPWVVEYFITDGFEKDNNNLNIAIRTAQIAFPYILFMSLATLIAAILNSLSRFAAAAAAPIILNLCLLVALGYGMTLDGGVKDRQTTVQLMAIAVSLSGVLQILWLGFFLRRAGFKLGIKPPRITEGVKELTILAIPAIFGAGVYQIGRFIDLFFLSTLPVGSYTHLQMADRWNQLPLGVIGIALSTAILPSLSRLIGSENTREADRLQSNAIEFSMLLTLPSAVALFFTGTAFVQVFMTGQAFTQQDADTTGMVVSALVIGLPAYVLVKVLTPNFFARKDTRTPVITAAISLGITVVLNYYFIFILSAGVEGLALAGAIGAWVNIFLLCGILHRKGFYRIPIKTLGRIVRILLSTAVMGSVLWFLMKNIGTWFVGSIQQQISGIFAIIVSGSLSYCVSALLLGAMDKKTLDRLAGRTS